MVTPFDFSPEDDSVYLFLHMMIQLFTIFRTSPTLQSDNAAIFQDS